MQIFQFLVTFFVSFGPFVSASFWKIDRVWEGKCNYWCPYQTKENPTIRSLLSFTLTSIEFFFETKTSSHQRQNIEHIPLREKKKNRRRLSLSLDCLVRDYVHKKSEEEVPWFLINYRLNYLIAIYNFQKVLKLVLYIYIYF